MKKTMRILMASFLVLSSLGCQKTENPTENQTNQVMDVIFYSQSGQTQSKHTYTYDENENLISRQNGDVTTLYEYKQDRLIKATSGDFNSTYTYNPANDLIEVVKTEKGKTVGTISYEYDANHRLVKMITNNLTKLVEATYTYNQADQVIESIAFIDDLEYKTEFEYDNDGNCIKESLLIDGVLDNEIESVYENGSLVSQTQKSHSKPINVELQYKYNEDNQVIEELTSEDGGAFYKNKEYIYR